MAVGLYETSLFEGQGNRLNLSLGPMPAGGQGELSFATGSMQSLKSVADHKLAVSWINPSVALAMAVKGTGPYTEPLPLKAIAVHPSYDLVLFAVHEDTGITSLADIREKHPALRVSTGRTLTRPFLEDSTMFAVNAVLEAAGIDLDDFPRWGGELQMVFAPPRPERRAAVEERAADAVFDEGVKTWGPSAMEHGMRFLPLDEVVLRKMDDMGFRRAMARPADFPGLKEEVPTVDFSGWPMVVHADMPEDMAYALVQGLDTYKDPIPTDNYKPLTMEELCVDSEETPWQFPMHPGAERYYREKGYLN